MDRCRTRHLPPRERLETLTLHRHLVPRARGRRSCRHGDLWGSRKDRAELSAGVDAELGEDLVEMPFDGAGADEELLADLRVRAAAGRELCDLLLLWGEVEARVVGAPADGLTGREQLSAGALGELAETDIAEDAAWRA